MSRGEREKKIIFFNSFYFLIFLSIFLLDQLIKRVVFSLFLPGESFPIIGKIFSITLVLNRGIAFGLLPNLPLFILILGIILFMWFLFVSRNGRIKKLTISLVGAGALSNLCDRLRFGYVIDYLDFHIWPVFNLADSSITIGIFLFFWKILRTAR